MKRIAIFLPDLTVGGAERSMLKLANGIVSRGIPVDLVLSRAVGELLDEVPDAVNVVDLGSRRVLTSVPALVRYLREVQPTALLSLLHANIFAAIAKKLSGVSTKLVISERNTLSNELENYSDDMRFKLMPFLVKTFYPWADAIIVVSKGAADDLAKILKTPREHIHVIYNPIVTPGMKQLALAPLSDPWFRPGDPPVILGVGRLTLQKDFATLLRAFSLVRQAKNARLLIIGEGEERPNLEALAEELELGEDIRLPGFIANPYPYMTRAAVFVLSSGWEGLPGVLIEALYCGPPLVSTDCPSGPREILADGKYGRLVPVGDVDALSKAILQSLDEVKPPNPPERWQPFELERIVDQYLDLLLDHQV